MRTRREQERDLVKLRRERQLHAQRRRRAVRWGLIFVASLLLATALVGDASLMTLRQLRRDVAALRADLDALRAEGTRLREEGRRLREEAAAIEDVARRELGLVRPGERLVLMPGPHAGHER